MVTEAVKVDGSALVYASDSVKNNFNVIDIALNTFSKALQQAGKDVVAIKKLVKKAVKLDPHSLQYAADELKSDKDIVETAVRINGETIKQANKDILNDSKLIKLALISDIV